MSIIFPDGFDPVRVARQTRIMLEQQLALNERVTPDWRDRRFAWHRAIYVEAAEYLEHLGTYKWWKKAKPDLAQANLELVDIWHFGLSRILDGPPHEPFNLDACAAMIVDRLRRDEPPVVGLGAALEEARHAAVDALVGEAGRSQRFDLSSFVALMAYGGLTFDALYETYVGKNVLNRFRQDHGYQDGTYRKVWAGLEDNEHLAVILQALTVEDRVPGTIRECLERRYRDLAAPAPSAGVVAPTVTCSWAHEPAGSRYETDCGQVAYVGADLELTDFCPHCGHPVEETVFTTETP